MKETQMGALSDPDLQDALRDIAMRFAFEAKGTPAHEAKVRLGKKRGLLDELAKRRILHHMNDRYVPAFLAFESQGADLRKHARASAAMVLNALKRLYIKNGPQDFTLDNVLAEVSVEFPPRKAGWPDARAEADAELRIRNTVNLGMLIATDFSGFTGSWTFSADDKVTSMRVRDGILDYEDLKTAWSEELLRRDSGAASLGFVERSDYLPPGGSLLETPASTDFAFVSDPKLRQIVERDYAELQRIKSVSALKSRLLLAAGLVEALLLDTLRRNEDRAISARRAEKDRDGQVKPLEEWHLGSLIDVATEIQLITQAVEKFSHGIRDYRNLVHPGKEVRSTHKLGAEEADIAEKVLEILIRDLKGQDIEGI